MTLTDAPLISLLNALTPAQRRSVEAHMRGERTPESRALVRRMRVLLKRKAKAKRRRR
jgi:hypothetical protein